MTNDQIRDAFVALRSVCDPRGFPVLDALEGMMLTQATLIQGFLDRTAMLEEHSDVVRLIDPYSRKA